MQSCFPLVEISPANGEHCIAAVFILYGMHIKVQSLILILVYHVGSGANVWTVDAKAGVKTQKDCTKG